MIAVVDELDYESLPKLDRNVALTVGRIMGGAILGPEIGHPWDRLAILHTVQAVYEDGGVDCRQHQKVVA